MIFKEIEEKYRVLSIFYAKGPGSFMAIKVSYVFLKSYAIVKNIPLFATDGFYFNGNLPIKAMGKMFFIKEGDNITFDKITPKREGVFKLPKILTEEDYSKNSLPLYMLPAV